ncbi:FHA domain-containing protein [Chondromyces apiculatus]|uniref:FHA domain/tetratricopeptide repeat protein n=1 Tax=Chondromyces apiculatus DSM 436 TaxID=1192034 RepID=A0A017T9X3_9BACT|nr:FHA domain-containing protein [Chondromyces apiculatus]EYF06053.1 FHA domain/tetratricopeptide repeat protein [Chondromyces apiculatus DSM 436]
MWKLTIEDDEGKQTTLPLAHDEYSLGRAEVNSVRLTDRNISRKHAVLVKNSQGWLLQDLDSYNGTFVNGVRVAGEQHLRHADLVQLGDYRLEVVDESLLAVPMPAPEGRGTTLSPLHTRPDRLVMIVGPTPGAEYALDGDRLSIGRSEECSVSINHSSVSRLHADLLKIDKGRYEVIDQGSANGIRINGVELKRGLLEAGDALELGDVRLRFVGAGKIFRPVETSLLNPIVTPGGVAGQGALGGQSGAWKIVVGLVLLAVVAGAAVYALTRSDPGDDKQVESAQASKPEEQERIQLQRAKESLDRGEYDKAHQLAQQLPEASTVRQDPLFREVENRWAQWAVERGQDKALSTSQRYELLASVAGTQTVDAAMRDRAIDLMAKVIEEDPSLPPVNPAIRGSRLPGGGGTNSYVPQPVPQPVQTSVSSPTKIVDPPAANVPEMSGYAAQRKSLEPKVWGGRASVEEIKMLRAICNHMGDKACRDRAGAMLKQKEASGP